MTVTSKERATLRSIASSLSPIVYVGKSGLTENVVSALDQALEAHELVKIRFQSSKEEAKDIASKLSEHTASLLVAVTGFTAVFYRESSDKEKRHHFI